MLILSVYWRIRDHFKMVLKRYKRSKEVNLGGKLSNMSSRKCLITKFYSVIKVNSRSHGYKLNFHSKRKKNLHKPVIGQKSV